MVFSSLSFLVFFLPIVFILYFITPYDSVRNGVLVVFSLLFYAWGEPTYILIMLIMVTGDYLLARKISSCESQGQKKFWLILSLIMSLGFLFYFKYINFIIDNINALAGTNITHQEVALPIGISFYTFQVLTYVIDVYKGKVQVQKNFFRLLLYVSFFPQLIAGPIVNYKDIEVFLEHREISGSQIYNGLLRFIWGLGKKCLLANTCGSIVTNLNGNSDSLFGAWLFAIAFSLQIYFDFSGYSDMAIGLGKIFGFTFKENFLNPYTASSATDFWRKWHISLGAFFREYVYIPLGGNRRGIAILLRNTFIVWFLTGIWHGASWNFVVWGLYYGILILLEKTLLSKIKEKLPYAINLFVSLIFIAIGWVIFYYIDISAGIAHIGRMFGIGISGLSDSFAIYYFKNSLGFLIIGCILCANWAPLYELALRNSKISNSARYVKPIISVIILLLSVVSLCGQSYNPFLYFRF